MEGEISKEQTGGRGGRRRGGEETVIRGGGTNYKVLHRRNRHQDSCWSITKVSIEFRREDLEILYIVKNGSK